MSDDSRIPEHANLSGAARLDMMYPAPPQLTNVQRSMRLALMIKTYIDDVASTGNMPPAVIYGMKADLSALATLIAEADLNSKKIVS